MNGTTKTWRDFAKKNRSGKLQLDGRRMLEHAITRAQWLSLENALAALTVFAHRDAIAALSRRAPFRVIRAPKGLIRGSCHEKNGQRVIIDDNTSAHAAFRLVSDFGDWNDVTVNHLYPSSCDPEHYTNPMNIVLTPTFLAKLTDSQARDQTPGKHRFLDILRFRAFELYCYLGPNPNFTSLQMPANYPAPGLWADPVGEGLTGRDMQARLNSLRRKSPNARHVMSLTNDDQVSSSQHLP